MATALGMKSCRADLGKGLGITGRGAGELRKKFLDDSLPCAFSKKIENFKAATL